MLETSKYFQLFANCIVVKGATRGTICDLQRGCYIFISTELADILLSKKNQTIGNILNTNSEVLAEDLDAAFKQIIEFDLGHYVNDPNAFPDIPANFEIPFEINDCIIELSNFNYENIDIILQSLTALGCQVLELRCYKVFEIALIEKILFKLSDTRIRNVELYVRHYNAYSIDTYVSFMKKNLIIGTLLVHGFPENSVTDVYMSTLVTVTELITSADHCGKIGKENFTINLPFYLHGKKHNTCLYKKVSIDANGSIMNCPSMKKSYGNIANDGIVPIVNSDEFRSLWNITKDKIEDCKICEFRYICSDCRAFLNNPMLKPLKCNYDPKQGKDLPSINAKELH